MQKIRDDDGTGGKASKRKSLKICCCSLLLIIVVLVIVFVSLFFTVFKPKDPILTPYPTKLQNVHFRFDPSPSITATLNLIINVKNPNRGDFEYKDATASLDYRGISVAGIPVQHGTVPGRGEINVTTYANVTGDKIAGNPSFLEDMAAGSVMFTSSAALPGKVKVVRTLKIHATVLMTCDVCVFTNQSYYVQSTCNARIKL
nr:Late embryogenesis abundant protein, LEA-14 [Ipomoea batatas]GME21608.1 Late embryogenesis abundant protein, LEA-14 [Ipomoea batatas]